MEELVKYLKYVKDERQEHKVKHKIYDISCLLIYRLIIIFFKPHI